MGRVWAGFWTGMCRGGEGLGFMRLATRISQEHNVDQQESGGWDTK